MRYLNEPQVWFHLQGISGVREETLGLNWNTSSGYVLDKCQIGSGYKVNHAGGDYRLFHTISEEAYNHQPSDHLTWDFAFWMNTPQGTPPNINEGALGIGWSSVQEIVDFTDRISCGVWLEWSDNYLTIRLKVDDKSYVVGGVAVPYGKHYYRVSVQFYDEEPVADVSLRVDNEVVNTMMSTMIDNKPTYNLCEEIQVFAMTYTGDEGNLGFTVEDIVAWLDAPPMTDAETQRSYDLGLKGLLYANHYGDSVGQEMAAYALGHDVCFTAYDSRDLLPPGLWGLGKNDQYQLGLNMASSVVKGFAKLALDDCEQVEGSTINTYFLKQGQVYAAGSNGAGQAGQLTTGNPIRVPTLMKHLLTGGGNTTSYSGFVSIHTGTTYDVVALRGSNPYPSSIGGPSGISFCGSNAYGEAGLGYVGVVSGLRDVGITNVARVCNGSSNVFVVKWDGTAWGTGRNYAGALAIGSTTQKTVFTQCSGDVSTGVTNIYSTNGTSFFVKEDGSLYAAGNNQVGLLGIGSHDASPHTTAVRVSGINNVVKMRCGSTHVLAQTADNKIYAWGLNSNGECGVGVKSDYVTVPTQISGMSRYTITDFRCLNNGNLYLDVNHWLWSVGYNDSWTIGLPVDGYSYMTPVVIASGLGIDRLYGSNNQIYAVGGLNNPLDQILKLRMTGHIQVRTG